MGISIGGKYPCKATVWEKEVHEKYTDVKLSTSKKNQNGGYETDFSAKCRFIGTAHTKASALARQDKITPTSFDVGYKWDNEKQKAFLNLVIFDFEFVEQKTQPNVAATDANGFMQIPDDLSGEGLPF